MRNWALARKEGGVENSIRGRSVAVETVVILAAVGEKNAATPGPASIGNDGEVGATTWRSLLRLGLDIVQFPAQHGIEACMLAAGPPGFPLQHMAEAGTTLTRSISSAAKVVASCLLDDEVMGCAVIRAPVSKVG